jgi:uncharacterized protein YjbI with pentapeptide repeats
VVGYDVARDVRDKERRVAAETDPTQASELEEGSKEHSSSIPTMAVVLATVVLVGIIVYGYLDMPGSGWIGVANKKFWNYLDLLIVPAALALGVYWLNRRQDKRDRKVEDAQKRRELVIQDQRSQDEALQAYLDQLTLLLVTQRPQGLVRMQVDDDVRQVIQARSEPLLRSLNPTRRWSLILFLSVMGLLTKDRPLVSLAGEDLQGIDGRRAPLEDTNLVEADLSGADLNSTNLSSANLNGANLNGADLVNAKLNSAILIFATLSNNTDLRGADLRNADLRRANLAGANLSNADLSGTRVHHADLNGANLSGATLRKKAFLRKANLSYANLSDADLSDADLSEADLSGADLRHANLIRANLRGADLNGAKLGQARGITNDGVKQQAYSLKGATMPNGQKYEDWLKVKEGREDGEDNLGPS